MRKSEQLGLSFPYDWSNPDIADDALILNVLERGIFEDVCRICIHYGIRYVETLSRELPDDPFTRRSLERMFTNIEKGCARVRSGSGA